MLAAFRTFAKSWVAAALIGLLIVAFAIFGVNDVFHSRISTDVITAGSQHVSAEEFKREFDQRKAQAEQQYGQPISYDMIAQAGMDRRFLDDMATSKAFAELVKRLGIRPSDALLLGQIEKFPAFTDPVTGKFDKATYQRVLAANNLTPDSFEAQAREELAERQLGLGLAAGLRVPYAYSAMAASYMLESRDLAYIPIAPTSVPAPAAPTDAQLTAFMQENSARLMRPEFRTLTVVRFDPAQLAGQVQVSEDDVRKQYDFRKDTLSTPEKRTVVQIPAKDAADAQQIVTRLNKGEAPDAIAKSLGVEAITYADKPRSAIPDQRVAATAFGLQPNQVAQVQGDLGLAVVKVLSVTPGHAVTFEEARPAIEADRKKNAAADKANALSQAYDDAHQKGATLTEAAAKAGVPTTTLGPVSKDGRDLQGKPVPGVDQKLLDTAFALPSGGESEITDAGGGAYFAVRVDKVIPPALPALAEVKPQLTRVWMMRELAKRMQAKADELAARVKKGESLDAVAASTGVKVVRVADLTRQAAAQNQDLSQDMLGKLFSSKPGDVFTADEKTFGMAVGRLEAVHAGALPLLARMTAQSRDQMSQNLTQEILQTAQAAARQKVKVTVNYARARSALGLQPIEANGKPGPAQ